MDRNGLSLVVLQDMPRNAVSQPLQIKLSIRLGLGCLTDYLPALQYSPSL